MRNAGAIIICLIWSGMTLLFNYLAIGPVVRQALASRYAVTEGTILTSEVVCRELDEGDVCFPRFTYSYFVAGREFSGRRYQYSKSYMSPCGWAGEVVSARPPGTKVTVYYDSRQPAKAVLNRDITGGDLFIVMFMAPFNGVMLYLAYRAWQSLRRQFFGAPVAGGVEITKHLRQTRVRLTSMMPFTAGVGTVAALSFFGVFVVLIISGGSPSFSTMTWTWIFLLAVGIVGAIWQVIEVWTGKYDLILDESNNSWVLPLTQGRKTRCRISLASIICVYVEAVEKRDNEGNSAVSYVPSIRLEENGTDKVESLIEWQREDKAREFISWLRKQLPPRKFNAEDSSRIEATNMKARKRLGRREFLLNSVGKRF